MKKITQTLALLLGLLYASPAMAHHDGEHPMPHHTTRNWAGGSFTYWRDSKVGTETISINPEYGRLLSDKLGVGVVLGFEKERNLLSKHSEQKMRISPFARYYYFEREPFNLYLDAGFGLSFNREHDNKWKTGWEVGVRPGACLDLTQNICLCLRFGFLGYRSGFTAGEEEGLSHQGFGFRLAPEELMIGIEFEF